MIKNFIFPFGSVARESLVTAFKTPKKGKQYEISIESIRVILTIYFYVKNCHILKIVN